MSGSWSLMIVREVGISGIWGGLGDERWVECGWSSVEGGEV